MNGFYLNIGLWHANTQNEMMVARACAAVEAVGIRIKRIALVRKRDEEPSLVIHAETLLDRKTTAEEVLHAANILDQDCIAMFWRGSGDDAGVGELIGPRADAWGAFDARFFHFL